MIDIHVTVDDVDHLYFRRPHRVVDHLVAAGMGPVRSVTVLERRTGLTSVFRDTEFGGD